MTLEAVEVRSLMRTLKMLIVPSLVLLKLQKNTLVTRGFELMFIERQAKIFTVYA